MSPLIGIFVITLISSILYNKFDANSRTQTTRTNPYYPFEKPHAKSEEKGNLKGEKSSEDLDENEDSLAFENISEMDVCIFTIVAGNQRFCKEKTDENINRLTLLMMSCQTASDDNKFPKCSNEKAFSECISRLSTANLEIFQSVKKRALTVCQEVSQQLFMINSQRRAQALLETAQLHSSVMTSFKDNQKLLESITTQTLTRLRAQRVAFMKDMRLFKKYFTKNESLLIEAAKSHFTLLSRHKEIIGGLEKDVNVLTEGFLQSLEAMQDNFTAFSVKIFEKHGEIMENLNRVENTADKILKQLEMIEEHDYTVTLKNAFNWMMANLWRFREMICVGLSSIIYSLVFRSTWMKFVLISSAIGGVFLKHEYVGLLIAAWFISILAEIFIRCLSYMTSSEIQMSEVEINSSIGNGSALQIQENTTGETSGENSTLNDSLGPNSGNWEYVRFGVSSSGDNMGSDPTETCDTATENESKQTPSGNHVLPPGGKCVQTTTICDNEVQTGPGSDMAVQTSTRCDSEVQTGASENVSVQTSTRNENSTQTNKVVGVQVETRDNRCVGIQRIQTGTVNDTMLQTSTRGDSLVQADGNIPTEGSSYIQRDTNVVTEGDRSVHERANSAFRVVQKSIRGDSTGQLGYGKDLVVQSGGKTYDFGEPHEPLGIQDEITASIPRQSGIIVNIGDSFSNSRGQTPSPRRQSRTASPFEVVAGDIRRSSGTLRDISGEPGTATGELSSIQVGVQINRSESSGPRRECGLMTLQGTPCRRRVSAGRCYIHSRDSSQ